MFLLVGGFMKIYVCRVCGRQAKEGERDSHRRACDLVREALAEMEAAKEKREGQLDRYKVEVEYF
jgi:predicted metal-binding protein|tara:strand:- start:386 stop:580 length:195 start_codon:yes stop_codon:yes gene_type:complete